MSQRADTENPSGLRLAAAFFVAPLAATLLFWLYLHVLGHLRGVPINSAQASAYALVAFVYFGLLPALLFGIPAYLLFRRRIMPLPYLAMATGGIVAAIPYALFFLVPFAVYWRTATNPIGALIHSALPTWS
jgi:hypothetical protein